MIEGGEEDRSERDAHAAAGEEPQCGVRDIQVGNIFEGVGGGLFEQIQIGVRSVQPKGEEEKDERRAKPPTGKSAFLPAGKREEDERDRRGVEFTGAARAQWKLTVADVEGALADAMTDRVPDAVRLAEQTGRRDKEPRREGKHCRDGKHPAQKILKFGLSRYLFHGVHYMGIYVCLQEGLPGFAWLAQSWNILNANAANERIARIVFGVT